MSFILLDYLAHVTCAQSLVALVILLSVLFYMYSTSYHGVWEKVGVPGPKPLPILNHSLELRQGTNEAYQKWFSQYGKTFGVYGVHPHKATLVTKDLNLIKEILVKDFDNFSKRYRLIESLSSLKKGLGATSSTTWQRHRNITNTLFTGAKLKTMLPHVNLSCKTLVELIGQCVSKGELIPVKDVCAKFSVEVMSRIAFGIETHAASKEESEFAYHTRNLLDLERIRKRKFKGLILYFFPHLHTFLQRFFPVLDFINFESDKYFQGILKTTMASRRKEKQSGANARDLLDLFMKASMEDHDSQTGPKQMTDEEIVGNSELFIMAGVETVSTALQGIVYSLAQHPDIQSKIIQEIDELFQDKEKIEYENLSQLKYTERVINEGLRMFPLVSNIARLTSETKTYNGVTIVKGSVVEIPLELLMIDPEYWTEPRKFDPDRFSPENKAQRDPTAFLPIGFGPRVCLGQRLAMLELKTVLVYLLKQFQFVLSERTEPKLGETMKMENTGVFIKRPVNPVLIEASKRF